MTKAILTFLCSFAIMANVNIAHAVACMNRDAFLRVIADEYKEQVVFSGISQSEPPLLIETYNNPETSTWTIIASHPNGMSCLVSHGKHFEIETQKIKPNL